MADLGLHARGRDDHLAAPSGHRRVHVGHVHAVAERDVVARNRVDRLRDGHALAGERRLLDLEGRRQEQAPVGRDLVAGLERHDVPGYELFGGDVDGLSPTPCVRLDHEHLLERGDALGRLALLVQAQHRVDDGDAEDREPRPELLERDDAHDRGADEDELHQVAVLAHERVPAGLLRLLGEPVRPVFRAPLLNLGRVEAGSRVHGETRVDLLRRQAVPRLISTRRCRSPVALTRPPPVRLLHG